MTFRALAVVVVCAWLVFNIRFALFFNCRVLTLMAGAGVLEGISGTMDSICVFASPGGAMIVMCARMTETYLSWAHIQRVLLSGAKYIFSGER